MGVGPAVGPRVHLPPVSGAVGQGVVVLRSADCGCAPLRWHLSARSHCAPRRPRRCRRRVGRVASVCRAPFGACRMPGGGHIGPHRQGQGGDGGGMARRHIPLGLGACKSFEEAFLNENQNAGQSASSITLPSEQTLDPTPDNMLTKTSNMTRRKPQCLNLLHKHVPCNDAFRSRLAQLLPRLRGLAGGSYPNGAANRTRPSS